MRHYLLQAKKYSLFFLVFFFLERLEELKRLTGNESPTLLGADSGLTAFSCELDEAQFSMYFYSNCVI